MSSLGGGGGGGGGAAAAAATYRTAFERAHAATPRALPAQAVGASSAKVEGDSVWLSVAGLPAAWQGKALDVFPQTGETLTHPRVPSTSDKVVQGVASHVGEQAWSAGPQPVWSARLPLSSVRSAAPPTLAWVLALDAESWQLTTPVQGVWPVVAGSAATLSPALQAALDQNAAAAQSNQANSLKQDTGIAWMLALLGAFVGGLVLNLMPCVFPVLAMKVLAFSQAAGSGGARGLRSQGLAYTLGVVVSCLALGGAMLALRAGGEKLGWGFQLQSPSVVATLAVLFMLLGCNLMGWFAFRHWLPSGLAGLRWQHPAADAFLSGVLAVAIASPCSAPFMGASLGYAIALPTAQALGIFLALGMGLALPYLLASWLPGWLGWLPKPGAWMETLRHFMAFPMWATVVWLLWVLAHLAGVDVAFGLLALLLALALVVWAFNLLGRSRKVLAPIALLVLLLLGNAFGPGIFQSSTPPPSSTGANGEASSGSNGGASGLWQAWSVDKVRQAQSAGSAVFVDFTAAWCITCQFNKKNTLSNPLVLEDFARKKVTLLRADWTRRDPAITQALESLGRSGVPVYVLYPAQGQPMVFSEILDKDALRAALARL
jgi:thiol:disulfide interchange protein DsbD